MPSAGAYGEKDATGQMPESRDLPTMQRESLDTRSIAPQETGNLLEKPCSCPQCSRKDKGASSLAKPTGKQQLAWEVDLGQIERQPARPSTSRRPVASKKGAYQWEDDSITVSLDSEADDNVESTTAQPMKKQEDNSLHEDTASGSDTEVELSEMLSDCSLSDLDSESCENLDETRHSSVPTLTAKVCCCQPEMSLLLHASSLCQSTVKRH